ncbi:MAG: 1,4-alpha-glucan branching enzyme, partial [Oscillospiraceae bacterium]
VFDFQKNEVQCFLISNAMFWAEKYHIDGLRVDAVASMLYLDYGKKDTNWQRNKFGSNENLEAIAFLKNLNRELLTFDPSLMMIAEESTAFPKVTKPDYDGGLGFNMKWSMGWMHDLLSYMQTDPLFRKGRHNNLTFSMTYAFAENYILPLSHDEIVYGKGSMIKKMPGEYDQKFDNLRAFYGFMLTHPGKKLNYMGNEFAQFEEWNYAEQLDWKLLAFEKHARMKKFIRDLNKFYYDNPPLWEIDYDWEGFRWISADDCEQNIIAFRRIDKAGDELVIVCNFSAVTRTNYRIGVPYEGKYIPVLNSDDKDYGGSGTHVPLAISEKEYMHGHENSIEIVVPQMSTVIFKIKKMPTTKLLTAEPPKNDNE